MRLIRVLGFTLSGLVWLAASLGVAVASDAPPERLWPMAIRPAVSSNFCEYREGHLHAGVDIRTFGEEGVPCLASGDGHVSRIRASAEGYGRVVYVQLDSGETLVYAHLSEFPVELERIVRDEQERRGRYRVDVRLSPSRWPVRRGDVIGYSGMTGATAPHLHFEVRNEQEHPLDPFSQGFGLDDGLAPRFGGVRMVPLDSGAVVRGACYPAETSARRVDATTFELPDTVALWGRVGLSVEVFDLLNAESGRLAPSSLELTVEGELVASISFERFSFRNTSQVGFVYDMSLERERDVHYVQLFRRRGETLWDREFAREGALVPPGAEPGSVHRAVLTARDRAGNEASLRFAFVASRDAHATRSAGWVDDAGYSGLPGLYIHEDLLCARAAAAAAYPFSIWGKELGRTAEAEEPLVITARELSTVPLALPLGAEYGAPEVFLIGVPQGQPRSVRFADLGLELIFGEASLFTDAVLFATGSPASTRVDSRELLPRSQPVRLGPHGLVMGADVEIRFTLGAVDSTSAIYRLAEHKGEWTHYRSHVANGIISTTARRPGVYAVFDDRQAPRIRRPFVSTRERYAGGTALTEVVIPIEDTGSGVDDERTVVLLDGKPQIARWDFVAKKMFVEVVDDNIIGPHTVSVVAYDHVGNHADLEASVVVTRKP